MNMRICRSGPECNEKPDRLTPIWPRRRIWGAIKPDLLNNNGYKELFLIQIIFNYTHSVFISFGRIIVAQHFGCFDRDAAE